MTLAASSTKPAAPSRDTRQPLCDGGCGTEAGYHLRANPMAPPEKAVFLGHWCGICVPASFWADRDRHL